MGKCPRCYNGEVSKDDNYCKICGLNLKEGAAAGTMAIFKEQLRRNKILAQIFNNADDSILHPEQRQFVLTSLEASDYSIESSLQHH